VAAHSYRSGVEDAAGDADGLYHPAGVPLSLDIRGWEEMHPLNSVGWSLFFEYIANILYAVWIRKFSKTALSILVGVAAIALAHLAITNGDVSGGWTLNVPQVRIGLTRTMYPFLCRFITLACGEANQIQKRLFMVQPFSSCCALYAAHRRRRTSLDERDL
jgi:peptidoglycan/LPS O-acetylase OafA/YrhL